MENKFLLRPQNTEDSLLIKPKSSVERALESDSNFKFMDIPSPEVVNLDDVPLIFPLLYRHPILLEKSKKCDFPFGVKEQLAALKLWKVIRHFQNTASKGVIYYLTAPQIGMSLRMFCLRLNTKYLTIANPEIVETTEDLVANVEESCLSLTMDKRVKAGMKVVGFSTKVPRHVGIRFRGFDVGYNEMIMGWLWDLDSIWFQHAMDHLDGKLIVDYATSLERTRNSELFRRLDKQRLKQKTF